MAWLASALESLGVVLGKEGVYLGELAKHPTVDRRGNLLIVETGHSVKNSAKEVYRLEAEFRENKCLIRGFQRLVTKTFGKPYRREFPFLQSPKGTEFFWVDPDQALHPLQATENEGRP